MLTEVSFYHLTKTPLEKALPQLLHKIVETGSRAVLLARNDEQLRNLDSLLWTFSTNKVVPHGSEEDGFVEEQPVFLSVEEKNPNNASVLVFTSGKEPSYINDFKKGLFIFDGNNQQELDSARQRWAKYKGDNFSLTYWKQNDEGGWEKAQK